MEIRNHIKLEKQPLYSETGTPIVQDSRETHYYTYRWYADALTYLSDSKETGMISVVSLKDNEDDVIVQVNLLQHIDYDALTDYLRTYYCDQNSTYPQNISYEEVVDAAKELKRLISAIKNARHKGFHFMTIEAE
jgi:hypothetical protein